MKKINTDFSRKDREKREMYAISVAAIAISLLVTTMLAFNLSNFTGFAVFDSEFEFEYVEPENITKEIAFEALLDAEDDLFEVKDFGLSSFLIEDMLKNAKKFYIGTTTVWIEQDLKQTGDEVKEDYLRGLLLFYNITPSYERELVNYSEVLRNTQFISFTRDQAFEIYDVLTIIEKRELDLKKTKIDTSKVEQIIKKAKESFEAERYTESMNLLEEANLFLDEVKVTK